MPNNKKSLAIWRLPRQNNLAKSAAQTGKAFVWYLAISIILTTASVAYLGGGFALLPGIFGGFYFVITSLIWTWPLFVIIFLLSLWLNYRHHRNFYLALEERGIILNSTASLYIHRLFQRALQRVNISGCDEYGHILIPYGYVRSVQVRKPIFLRIQVQVKLKGKRNPVLIQGLSSTSAHDFQTALESRIRT